MTPDRLSSGQWYEFEDDIAYVESITIDRGIKVWARRYRSDGSALSGVINAEALGRHIKLTEVIPWIIDRWGPDPAPAVEWPPLTDDQADHDTLRNLALAIDRAESENASDNAAFLRQLAHSLETRTRPEQHPDTTPVVWCDSDGVAMFTRDEDWDVTQIRTGRAIVRSPDNPEFQQDETAALADWLLWPQPEPEPRQIKVGDRVKIGDNPPVNTVIGVDGNLAWLKQDDGTRWTRRATSLTLVEGDA